MTLHPTSTMWTGYTVHLTEVCDDEHPHLIPHVATTPSSTTDEAMTESIHQDLKQQDLLPMHHLLDGRHISQLICWPRASKRSALN